MGFLLVIVIARISWSERAGENAAVDENVLSGNVAGVRRAKESAHGAEFVGLADAARRYGGDALGEGCVVADLLFLHGGLDIGPEAIGLEYAGQHEVDGDV